MKYSIVLDIMYSSIGPNGPIWPNTDKLLEGMGLAEALGFSAVEFWDWTTRDTDAILDASKARNLQIVSICSKNRKLFGDPEQRPALVEGFRETVLVAQKLGCKNIILANPVCKDGMTPADTRAELVAALKELAPIAEAADVTIILEPVSGGRFFTNSDVPFSILREVNSPNVKLLYDIYHYQMMEGNICNTIKANLDLIGHIHIAGCPMRCELDVGELDCHYVLQFLQDIGYDKYVGLEFPTMTDREGQLVRSKSVLV